MYSFIFVASSNVSFYCYLLHTAICTFNSVLLLSVVLVCSNVVMLNICSLLVILRWLFR